MRFYIVPGIFFTFILALVLFLIYSFFPAISPGTCLEYRITNAELSIGQVIDSEYVKATCYVQVRESQWYKHGTYSRSEDWNPIPFGR